MSSPLVSTKWLAENLDKPDVKVVDGSWYLPNMERDAEAEFAAHHIPGAVRFDIDAVADKSTGLPHMVADEFTFAAAAGGIGLSETDTIIIYDGMGLFSAARVWWYFRIMGAKNVFVLAGGLPKWSAEKRQMESGDVQPAPTIFKAKLNKDAVASADEVQAVLESNEAQVVDMRPAARFTGEAGEPRAELRSGHMPGALNLPFTQLLADGQLADDAQLMAALESANVDPEKPLVTSCGSGVTATILNLALAQLGYDVMRVYDGAWAEWGMPGDRPVVTG